MPVFDSHVHIFPDAIAVPAVTAIGKAAGIEPDYDGTRAALVKRLQDAGCDGAMNCPIATAPKQVRSINDWCASINEWPVLSLGSIHPDFPNPVAELERIHSLGLYGIKLHPEYQSLTPDDPRMDPIWDTCVGLGMPIVIHAGEDIGFEPPYHSDPAGLAKLVERVPGLTLIAAHLGGYRNWDEVEACLAGTPVYLDLSFALGELPDEQVMRIIEKHGSYRVLYGTDAPWQNPCDYLQRFAALPLKKRDRRWIQWDNAAELFGLETPSDDEATDVEEETTFPWQERDRALALPDDALLSECRVDTFRGTGRGGQKRNRTESAVRVTHLASGVAASNDESRSQHTNRQLALRLLRWELALSTRNPTPTPPESPLPGWRSPAYAEWLAIALDHLAANEYQVGPAAREVGLSTGKLVHELSRHSRVWDAVNQARVERDLPPLSRR